MTRSLVKVTRWIVEGPKGYLASLQDGEFTDDPKKARRYSTQNAAIVVKSRIKGARVHALEVDRWVES